MRDGAGLVVEANIYDSNDRLCLSRPSWCRCVRPVRRRASVAKNLHLRVLAQVPRAVDGTIFMRNVTLNLLGINNHIRTSEGPHLNRFLAVEMTI